MKWVLQMQNRDGSWAAFDRDNNKKILREIPFADCIAPLDFGSPDITGHVLYVMGELGYLDPVYKRIIQRALKYLMKSQRDDGSWYGRWGVTFIYGTSKVLQALEVLENRGFSTNGHRKRTLDAMDWLVSCQNS